MSSLHRSCHLSTTTVTIIQKRFLVHLSTSQMATLSHFQAKLTNQNSQLVRIATPEFRSRRRSFKPIMKEDYSTLHLKSKTTQSRSSRNEIKFKFTKSSQKKKISFGLWKDISRWSFLLMSRRCLVGLVSTSKC